MKPLEVVIFVILLLMGVPDLCRKLRRPALVFPIYVLVGMLVGLLFDAKAVALLDQVGGFGFILLLFIIGLEIDLPNRHESLSALRNAALWILVQMPILGVIGYCLNASTTQIILAACALCGCSVSMAFSAWWSYPHENIQAKRDVLLWMVALEILAIVLIVGTDAGLQYGMGWTAAIHLAGVGLAILIIAYTADHLTRQLQRLLDFTTRWKVHFIVLLVLAVAAIGERLGLSAPKTAFCFGLFVSRATHEGIAIEHHLRPIGEKFLIPIFFVGLGTLVSPEAFISRTGLWAILTAFSIMAFRQLLYNDYWKRWLPGPKGTFLLVCPNLTIVGVAVQSMQKAGSSSEIIEWLLLSGLLMSIASVLFLPRTSKEEGASVPHGA